MENLLLDTMQMNGEGAEACKKAISLLSDITECVPVITDSAYKYEHDGIYHIKSYDKENNILSVICALTGKNMQIGNANAGMGKMADEIIDEVLSSSCMLMRFRKKSYYVSQMAYLTLCQRLGFSTKTMKMSYPERDMFIAQIMTQNPTTWKLCARKLNEKIYKIFAVHTGNYEYISQKLLLEICDTLSSENMEKLFQASGEVKEFHINHDFTSIVVEYPNAAKEIAETYGLENLVPCVRLSTSDTGRCSFVFESLWKRGHSYVVCDSFSVKHTGKKANRDSILKTMSQKLFPTYTKLPERLVELMNWEVLPAGASKKEINSFLKKLHKEIKIVKRLSIQTEICIRELLSCEFDTSQVITAFDIALCYLGLPERINGLKSFDVNALEQLCGQVPYAKCLEEKVHGKEEEIYLTA